jgi:hypothetical protein
VLDLFTAAWTPSKSRILGTHSVAPSKGEYSLLRVKAGFLGACDSGVEPPSTRDKNRQFHIGQQTTVKLISRFLRSMSSLTNS